MFPERHRAERVEPNAQAGGILDRHQRGPARWHLLGFCV